MIKKFTIQNYQSHEYTELDFHPGVNVIVGKSQSGKTAILRSLLKLERNRPRGFRFHSTFSDSPTRMDLFLDGSVITYENDGKEARYELDGRKFEKVATEVPDQIEKKLNFSDLNIQEQLDVPFLITSSPGEIARTVNKVTRLEQVDEWSRELTTRINQTTSSIESDKVEIKSDLEKLEKYDDLEETRKIIGDLGEVDGEITGGEKDLQFVNLNIDRIEKVGADLDGLKSYLLAEKYVSRAERLDDDVEDLLREKRLLANMADLKGEIVELEGVHGVLVELISLVKQEVFRDRLSEIIGKAEDLSEEIEVLGVEREKCKAEYIGVLEEFGKCPICFSPITEKCIQKVRKEL